MSRYVLQNSPNVALDKTILNRYLDLPQPMNKSQAEYLWIGGPGVNIRSQTRTINNGPLREISISDLPEYLYDGSFTEHEAHGENSEVCLKPVAIYNDPFRRKDNILKLCETYKFNANFKMELTQTNKRHECQQAMKTPAVQLEQPRFHIQQDYYLVDGDRPLGKGYLPCKGQYLCGVGADKVFGREIAEAHYRACLYAGVPISKANAGAVPSQWSYQVGPSLGIAAGDDLWVSRFILHRVAEEFGVVVTYDLNPTGGWTYEDGWEPAMAFTNFSTKSTRADNGIDEIHRFIERMRLSHWKDLKAVNPLKWDYYNRKGSSPPPPPSVNEFSSSNHDKAMVRIPKIVAKERKGHLEDRRPSSSCDPYSIINALVRTCLLNE